MKQQRHWMDRLTQQLDLDGEVDLDSVVEVVGDRRVLVEHHKGIFLYQQDRIGIHVKYGDILVEGCGMEIVSMTGYQLVITGRIDGICIERRKRV